MKITRGLACLGFMCTTRAAFAADQASLSWVRGEGADRCQSREGLATRVADRLGRNPFEEGAPLAIEGLVEFRASRWIARIYVRKKDGTTATRELASEASECESLDAAVTLAIALAIDPDAAMKPAPPKAPAPPVLPKAPPIEPVVPTAAPIPATTAPRGARGELSVRAIGSWGLLPEFAPGFSVAGRVCAHGPLSLTAGAIFLPEDRVNDFAFGLTSAFLGACADLPAGNRFSFGACANAYVGAMHAVVFTLEPTTPGERLWGAVGLSLEGRVRLVGPLTFHAGIEGLVPYVKPRFYVVGRSSDVFVPPAIAAMASVGLGISLE